MDFDFDPLADTFASDAQLLELVANELQYLNQEACGLDYVEVSHEDVLLIDVAAEPIDVVQEDAGIA